MNLRATADPVKVRLSPRCRCSPTGYCIHCLADPEVLPDAGSAWTVPPDRWPSAEELPEVPCDGAPAPGEA